MERTSLAVLGLTQTVSIPVVSGLPSNLQQTATPNLMDAFGDGTLSFGERKRVHDELARRDPDLSRECVVNLCRAYEQSGAKSLVGFLFFLLDHAGLNLWSKLECALVLHNDGHKETKNYLLQILREFAAMSTLERPAIAIFLDVLRYLLPLDLDLDVYREHVTWLIDDSEVSLVWLYKSLLSIQRDEERKVPVHLVDMLFLRFFQSGRLVTDPRHRILSAQYLLQRQGLYQSEVEPVILALAQDSSQTHEVQADAADLLLRLGSVPSQTSARKVITLLGQAGHTGTRAPSTFATNRENVHEVDAGASAFLLRLGGVEIESVAVEGADGVRRPLSFQDVTVKVQELVTLSDAKDLTLLREKVFSSLLRLQLDQILYPGSQSLSTIFVRLWQLIQKHEHRTMLEGRLMEELADMADTCSSGHAYRLANVFSGVDNVSVGMSFERQVWDNIAGRLNARLRTAQDKEARARLVKGWLVWRVSGSDVSHWVSPADQKEGECSQGIVPSLTELDEEFRAQVGMELTELEPSERVLFGRFFRDEIGIIREQLWIEYVDAGHLTGEKFEKIFRDGILFYETGSRQE